MVWNLFLRDLKSSNTLLGGVRVIFRFEYWKHDFWAIFRRCAFFFSIQSNYLENPLRLGKSWIFPIFGHFDGHYALQTARYAHKCIYWRIDNVLRHTLKPFFNYLWLQKGVYGPPSRQRGLQNGKIMQNPLKVLETLYIAQK